uniref:Uncharacterized protein n=1 Tax=Acrobeloides nanus TaxID=290746 RepID=A0A914E2E0_9BILA
MDFAKISDNRILTADMISATSCYSTMHTSQNIKNSLSAKDLEKFADAKQNFHNDRNLSYPMQKFLGDIFVPYEDSKTEDNKLQNEEPIYETPVSVHSVNNNFI